MADKPSIEETYEAIRKGAKKAHSKYKSLQGLMDAEDVAHNYFTHYLERGFHQKFDPERLTLRQWVGMGLRRWALDFVRSPRYHVDNPDGSRSSRVLSGDIPHPVTGRTLLEEFVVDHDPLSQMVVEEALASLPEDVRQAVEFRMDDHTLQEAGVKMGISRSTVGRLIRSSKGKVRHLL